MNRILLVDDHPVVLEGLKAALSKYEDLQIVGSALDGKEAIEKARVLHPQIVIMDIALPDVSGIEATLHIKKMDPAVKVIIHTIHSYKEFLVPLMRAGISAYVLKQRPISDLHLAVQVVRRGGTYLSEDASLFWANHKRACGKNSDTHDPFNLLSPREREVFLLLARGYSTKKTAHFLCISTKTVETHKYRIMDKLQQRSLTEWTKEAIRRGMIKV
jgi:two-component system response regulator NreC